MNNVDLAVNPSIRLSYADWQDILDPLFEEDEEDFVDYAQVTFDAIMDSLVTMYPRLKAIGEILWGWAIA